MRFPSLKLRDFRKASPLGLDKSITQHWRARNRQITFAKASGRR